MSNKESENGDDKEYKEKAVPSSSFGRAAGFLGLAAKIAFQGVSEGIKNTITGKENSLKTTILSAPNAEVFTEALCRMRGAALKVGQMISLQEQFLPEEISRVLSKVRDSANAMPKWQLEKVMKEDFGTKWRTLFLNFDEKPFAAASLGQVHKAVLKSGEKVAVKIQFPGVSKSIDSDLDNLKWISERLDLFPRGMYVQNIINAARIELAREVDYKREARMQSKMRELLHGYRGVSIPKVFDGLTTQRVIVGEFAEGVPIDRITNLPQETRNRIADLLLDITLKELFEFRFMQTDPNWSNFLYNENNNVLSLIDFGAARKFNKKFTDEYIQMVHACAMKNDKYIFRHSNTLGFTTGNETKRLKKLHVQSGYVLGEPFRTDLYNFCNETLVKDLTRFGKEMISDRLTPPPEEAYTLHRKLSGCYLTCVKLRATIRCKDLFLKRHENYDWEGVKKDHYDEIKTD